MNDVSLVFVFIVDQCWYNNRETLSW